MLRFGSSEIIFRDHNLKLFCGLFILFTVLLFHLVHREFLRRATDFSLNKSVNFEGSYDYLKAAKFDLS